MIQETIKSSINVILYRNKYFHHFGVFLFSLVFCVCFNFYIYFLQNGGQLYVCVDGFSCVNLARLSSPLRQSSTKMCPEWKWRSLISLEDRRSLWIIWVVWFNQVKGLPSRLSKERAWKTPPATNSIRPWAPACLWLPLPDSLPCGFQTYSHVSQSL